VGGSGQKVCKEVQHGEECKEGMAAHSVQERVTDFAPNVGVGSSPCSTAPSSGARTSLLSSPSYGLQLNDLRPLQGI
jgi:hypothetical protein